MQERPAGLRPTFRALGWSAPRSGRRAVVPTVVVFSSRGVRGRYRRLVWGRERASMRRSPDGRCWYRTCTTRRRRRWLVHPATVVEHSGVRAIFALPLLQGTANLGGVGSLPP
jgi:hypothetical protein